MACILLRKCTKTYPHAREARTRGMGDTKNWGIQGNHVRVYTAWNVLKTSLPKDSRRANSVQSFGVKGCPALVYAMYGLARDSDWSDHVSRVHGTADSLPVERMMDKGRDSGIWNVFPNHFLRTIRTIPLCGLILHILRILRWRGSVKVWLASFQPINGATMGVSTEKKEKYTVLQTIKVIFR